MDRVKGSTTTDRALPLLLGVLGTVDCDHAGPDHGVETLRTKMLLHLLLDRGNPGRRSQPEFPHIELKAYHTPRSLSSPP